MDCVKSVLVLQQKSPMAQKAYPLSKTVPESRKVTYKIFHDMITMYSLLAKQRTKWAGEETQVHMCTAVPQGLVLSQFLFNLIFVSGGVLAAMS